MWSLNSSQAAAGHSAGVQLHVVLCALLGSDHEVTLVGATERQEPSKREACSLLPATHAQGSRCQKLPDALSKSQSESRLEGGNKPHWRCGVFPASIPSPPLPSQARAGRVGCWGSEPALERAEAGADRQMDTHTQAGFRDST